MILDATLSLFLEKGYSGTNTDEIAAVSSVSKQTIYRHFADKDDLVREAIKSVIAATEEQGADAFDVLAESDDLNRDLRVFARRHIEDVIQTEIMRMRRRIIAEVDRFPDIALAWYEAAPKRTVEKLASCFERLRERGLLHMADSDLAAEQFNWLILSIPMNRAMFDSASVADTTRHSDFAEAAPTMLAPGASFATLGHASATLGAIRGGAPSAVATGTASGGSRYTRFEERLPASQHECRSA